MARIIWALIKCLKSFLITSDNEQIDKAERTKSQNQISGEVIFIEFKQWRQLCNYTAKDVEIVSHNPTFMKSPR